MGVNGRGSGSEPGSPFFTIIVPVFNAAATLERCLASIQASSFRDWELIVVDDGSQDASPEIASRYANQYVRFQDTKGPAYARNHAATLARGETLFFTDADCTLPPDTLANIAEFFCQHPEVEALIGSYDDEPEVTNFISQFKNLFHHFIHQTSSETAGTFWTGCGAIQRQTFLALGGFNVQAYPRPSIEDIELGYRLIAAGGNIHLAKQVQVKHLKTWTWFSLWKTDIFDRGIPWTRLLLKTKSFRADLNLQTHHRWSVALVWGMIFAAIASGIHTFFVALLPPAILLLLLLNLKLYWFFAERRGWGFALKVVPLHWMYYFYNGMAFILGTVSYLINPQ
ncbi:MAG: glycosyltransferase family A protein [Anaerolineales bacterium]